MAKHPPEHPQEPHSVHDEAVKAFAAGLGSAAPRPDEAGPGDGGAPRRGPGPAAWAVAAIAALLLGLLIPGLLQIAPSRRPSAPTTAQLARGPAPTPPPLPTAPPPLSSPTATAGPASAPAEAHTCPEPAPAPGGVLLIWLARDARCPTIVLVQAGEQQIWISRDPLILPDERYQALPERSP